MSICVFHVLTRSYITVKTTDYNFSLSVLTWHLIEVDCEVGNLRIQYYIVIRTLTEAAENSTCQ